MLLRCRRQLAAGKAEATVVAAAAQSGLTPWLAGKPHVGWCGHPCVSRRAWPEALIRRGQPGCGRVCWLRLLVP